MSNKLFDSWTWSLGVSKPFDTLAHTRRTDIKSIYNKSRTAQATVHSPLISAILAYMELEVNPTAAKGAIGTQGDMIIAEYPSHRAGETHAVVFNKKNGKFIAAAYSGAASPSAYMVKESGNTGAALFFALMPHFLTNTEFSENYTILLECKKDGYSDMQKAEDAAFILCDNVYRRTEGASTLGEDGIKIAVPSSGNIQLLSQMSMQSNVYAPTEILHGDFEIFKPGAAPVNVSVFTKPEDFIGKYAMSERSFSPAENSMIPHLPDWYIIPEEVVKICEHAKVTSASSQPMRNFMMRGPAGTGKTEGAKAIASGLGLPYVHITCSANTEIFDLLGQMLPDVDGMGVQNTKDTELPTFDDIRFDPPTAYEKLTGEYDEKVTEDAVYDKLLEVIRVKAMEESSDSEKKDTHQRFRYVDTPFVQAMRYGYLVELQEPAIISNPGVLVGLNALLDRCESITLPTGEIIRRHPDTVVVVTTNTDYAGCKSMNQSVISRMNLVVDMDAPDADTMAKRVMGITGCTEMAVVRKMAEVVGDIAERCREAMITDGSCGVRELISWVQSYMICKNELEAAKYTVLASVSADPENRAEILESCLNTKYA